MGRPPSLTPAQQKEAIRGRAQGATLQELADSYDRSISTMRRATRVHSVGPSRGSQGVPVLQYAVPQLIPTGGRAEEVSGGGEKQVWLPFFARQCHKEPDYLRIRSHPAQKLTVKRRPITDLVLGKPEICGRYSYVVSLFHAP